MDYQLNKIKLNNDSEYSSLYSWSLEEFDSEGNKVQDGFIPMQIGSIYFNIERLVYYNGFEQKGYEESSEFNESERINGELKSQDNDPRLGYRTTNTFSMFGTDREIKHFSISINKIDNGEKGKALSFRKKSTFDSTKENLFITSNIGYQAEADLDFPAQEAEDSLYINVFLEEEKFNKIVKYVKNGVKPEFIRIGHAEGFYNQWTPSIHLEDIKILSSEKSFEKDEPYVQQVEIPEGCDINPPRLGKLRDFTIHFSIESNKLDDNIENEDEYTDDFEEEKSVEDSWAEVFSYQLNQIENRGIKLNKSSLAVFLIPLWIIAISLLLILIL